MKIAWIRILRPKQWIKNAFVLAPLIFAGEFLSGSSQLRAWGAFILFCIVSSEVYLLNDLRDMDRDRRHPKKRHRPLPSGEMTVHEAFFLIAVLLVALGVGSWMVPGAAAVAWVYILVNLAYTFKLKHQPVLDIFTIAIGFVLRVYAGAVAIGVPLSSWMFVTTFCLALYLASIKRRQELIHTEGEGRAVLAKYSVSLMDKYAEISAVGTLLFYSLFAMTVRPRLIASIPLVLYALFRYWFDVEVLNEGESPADVIFSDFHLAAAVLVWLGICLWATWP